MKIRNIPLTITKGSITLWTGAWRIGEYTTAELSDLKADFIDKFGTGYVDLINTLGVATDVYEWIISNTAVPYLKGYFGSAEQYDRTVFSKLSSMFPVADFGTNIYEALYAIEPDEEGPYYNYYNGVYFETGENRYGPFRVVTAKNPPLSTYGADIQFTPNLPLDQCSSLSKGCCFMMPTTAGRNKSFDIVLPYRVVDESGNIIHLGSHDFNQYINGYPIKTHASGLFFTAENPPDLNYQMVEFLVGDYLVFDPDDPYSGGGTSGEDEGGSGSFDGSSDIISDSAIPSISAADTGFTRIYNPTLAQVRNLAAYLWTDTTLLDTLWNHIKQFIENPMDAFIAFNLVPCQIPDGGVDELKIMYVPTGVQLTRAATQFVDVDCGSLDIKEYYGSALDYAPYTKISLFLPYVGTVQLDVDDVMGKTISIKYRIDIVSGGCVAKVFVNGSIHYQYSGHCAINIPFTSSDFTGYVGAMISASRAIASYAAGGAGAMAANEEVATVESVAIPSASTSTELSIVPQNGQLSTQVHTPVDIFGPSGNSQSTPASFKALAPRNLSNVAGAVMGAKPIVERSGNFSGNTGCLGVRRPYCTIERPRMCNPEKYSVYNGRPSMIYMSLGTCTGYTKVQQVQLTGFVATNPELDEIESFLKGGVVF